MNKPSKPLSASFGTYALSTWREKVRCLASLTPTNKLGMWIISILRMASLLGHTHGINGPLDIEVAPGVRARLFPNSNRCEKRAFAGVHIWDAYERAVLNQAIQQQPRQKPFVFLDVGANIGLYSLFVNASANIHGKTAKIIAVEPDTENRFRLSFNFAASNCEGVIEPIGIAHEEGTGVLSVAGINRGKVAILDEGDGVSISLETLAGLFKRYGLTHIDAMKIDIEGRDQAALLSMVQNAPQTVWPKILIVETGRTAVCPIVTQMIEAGYTLRARAGINAIMDFA